MVAFYPHFVSCGEKATLKDVVGECFFIIKVIFVKCVDIEWFVQGIKMMQKVYFY